MGLLRLKENVYNYEKHNRQLKDQHTNGINDVMLTTVIKKELNAMIRTCDMSIEQVLSWAKRVEAQRA